MKHRRPNPPWRAVTLGLALLAAHSGCPGDNTPNNPDMMSGPIPEPTGTFTATSTTGEDTSFLRPLDSVPSADGSTIYFTAYYPEAGKEGMGVFKVPSAGGPVSKLFAGAPLSAPVGITLGSDDATLYIADSSAGHDPNDISARPGVGQIFKMPTDGGTPQVVSGTEGTRPRGVEISRQGNVDLLFFTGQDPATLAPGVLRISSTGGGLVTVASGAPFNDPSGIAAAQNGDLYVVDANGGDNNSRSSLIKVSGGSPSVLVSGIQAGYPAGVAITRSETLALVSGRDPNKNSDQIYRVNLGTKEVTTLSQGVSENTDAAGLHRARNKDIFSWADLSAGDRGKVYRVEFK